MKSIAAICLAATASACDWIWEECSWMWYRDLCDGEEGETDCGWVYWDDWTYEEFWVTCDEFADWYWCTGEVEEDDCDYEWYWDDCYEEWYQYDCYSDDGWWHWDDWSETTYWVSYDDWAWWCLW